MFVTTTIAMVFWTVFVQGITIKPLVKLLNVKTASEKDPTMNERIAGRFMDHVVTGMEGILGDLGIGGQHLGIRYLAFTLSTYCRVANSRPGYYGKNQLFPKRVTVNKHQISPTQAV